MNGHKNLNQQQKVDKKSKWLLHNRAQDWSKKKKRLEIYQEQEKCRRAVAAAYRVAAAADVQSMPVGRMGRRLLFLASPHEPTRV